MKAQMMTAQKRTRAQRDALTLLSGPDAYAVRLRSGFGVIRGEHVFERHMIGSISAVTMRKLSESGLLAFDRERQRWTLGH